MIIIMPTSRPAVLKGYLLIAKQNYTPIANLTIMVSATWFMRPDANADQNTLMPDILVPSEEALEKVLEYLSGLERGQ